MVSMIEIKHEVQSVFAIRNRGVATLIKGTNPNVKNVVLAKSSVSIPEKCVDANQYITDLIYNRVAGQKTMSRPFTSIRKQWLTHTDVFREEHYVTLNFEYDFKRRPVNPRMIEVCGRPHLAFDTVPWQTAQESVLAREIFDQWRETRTLKTLDDFNNWLDFYQTSLSKINTKKRDGSARTKTNVTKDGAAGDLKRMFLRAYAQKTWGLDVNRISYPALLEKLSVMGFEVKKSDSKNAHKGHLIPNSVAKTDVTEMLLDKLKIEFVTLETDKFFS
jgi:hypothetical protein